MPSPDQTVFLLDVDNTLLDNDRAQDEYLRYIAQECGPIAAARLWEIFQRLLHGGPPYALPSTPVVRLATAVTSLDDLR